MESRELLLLSVGRCWVAQQVAVFTGFPRDETSVVVAVVVVAAGRRWSNLPQPISPRPIVYVTATFCAGFQQPLSTHHYSFSLFFIVPPLNGGKVPVRNLRVALRKDPFISLIFSRVFLISLFHTFLFFLSSLRSAFQTRDKVEVRSSHDLYQLRLADPIVNAIYPRTTSINLGGFSDHSFSLSSR